MLDLTGDIKTAYEDGDVETLALMAQRNAGLVIDLRDRLAAIERQVRELADEKEASASRLHDEGCELLASDEYEDADRLRAIIDAPDAEGGGCYE